jgi:hypothetical protein
LGNPLTTTYLKMGRDSGRANGSGYRVATVFAHQESAKIHRLDGPAERTANECNSRSRHSGRSGRERVLFHLVLRSDLHRTLDRGCTACHSWPATKRVRMDDGWHLRQRNCCDGYRCLARLSAPSEDDNPPHTMTMRFQVAIRCREIRLSPPISH